MSLACDWGLGAIMLNARDGSHACMLACFATDDDPWKNHDDLEVRRFPAHPTRSAWPLWHRGRCRPRGVPKSQVVELRFFGGLSVEETASVLKVSPETVMRDWKLAKAWLLRELRGRSASEA